MTEVLLGLRDVINACTRFKVEALQAILTHNATVRGRKTSQLTIVRLLALACCHAMHGPITYRVALPVPASPPFVACVLSPTPCPLPRPNAAVPTLN